VDIRLPVNFTAAHRAAVLRFVQGKPVSEAQHAAQLEAFDLLHRAMAGDDTFGAFYERVVGEPSADSLIVALLSAPDPQAAAQALRREVNQQIPALLRKAGCANCGRDPARRATVDRGRIRRVESARPEAPAWRGEAG
jgi:hypothetical protein